MNKIFSIPFHTNKDYILEYILVTADDYGRKKAGKIGLWISFYIMQNKEQTCIQSQLKLKDLLSPRETKFKCYSHNA